jgi:hypothetical protein
MDRFGEQAKKFTKASSFSRKKRQKAFTQDPGQGQRVTDFTGHRTLQPPTGQGRSLGPRVLGLASTTDQATGPGFEEVPERFTGGTVSVTEYYIYWALEKLLGPEAEGRWGYQVSFFGGRHNPGGAVVDFVIYREDRDIGVRVQTYRFHQSADAEKQAHDREQLYRLFSDTFTVVDVYEEDFIYDPTGQAAIQLMIDILNDNFRLDPLTSGLTAGSG